MTELVAVRRVPAVPDELIRQKEITHALASRIVRDHSSMIGQKRYVHVAGATMLAGAFGYHVREVGAQRIDIGGVGGWEATCEVVTTDGRVLGRGSSICMDDEKEWGKRPMFARRAMASTRSAGRALRLLFGHMFTMLGDDVASVTREEMPD